MVTHDSELNRPGRMVGFARLLQRWRDVIETRRALRRLSATDDYMLKDIGISRGDIERSVRHGRGR